ncbi:large ribosomal subunit protein mL62 isoform X2 [Nothobranchius furzeri]|uniref:large ribosomal subunit protein mL62 isoform X2 n=1 Tax=Nothobranchius furzeri TaxID=105023 RepID=UPI0024045741|nr:peptidyl-tRNA hydrolase ICT1, mitochondrial isoform X2 [Nothobranchius furzeri]
MAACIGRHSYLLCCAGGLNVRLPHSKLREAAAILHYNICTSRGCYGSRERNETQDTGIQVPVDRLTVSYSRSSGPGGQHVNKVSTKAEVRFHVHTADWIPHDVRQKILEKNKNRINKAGELLVTSETSRSQQRNLSDCIQKISSIIAEASEKPREATAEESAVREEEQRETQGEENPFSHQAQQTCRV